MLNLNYIIDGTGWATIEISNGLETVNLNVSYLHDSLKDLTVSVLELKERNKSQVLFMDEPGEHLLVLSKVSDNEISYDLRWYDDWVSWGLTDVNNFKIMLSGTVSFTHYTSIALENLDKIYNEFGMEKYKQK